MEEVLVLVALAAGALVLLGLARASELFCLRIHQGQCRLLRGRAPRALIADFRDVLSGVREATLRAVVEGGRPSLRVRGRVSAEQMQRLRNVLGQYTTAQIRTAPRRRSGPRR